MNRAEWALRILIGYATLTDEQIQSLTITNLMDINKAAKIAEVIVSQSLFHPGVDDAITRSLEEES